MLNYTCDLGNNDNCTSLPKTIVIVNCVINAPLMLISIIGNALVLAAILRTPSLRSPSTIFLCSLAASDLLVGLVLQPLYVANELKPKASLRIAKSLLIFSLCGVSLGTIMAVSVDRFLALHYHMRYANLMTKTRALCESVAIWLICFPLSCLYFASDKMVVYATIVSITLCMLATTFCYIKIYIIVRRHQFQIHVQQQAVQLSLNQEQNMDIARSKKSAMSTFTYYISMVLCYSPVFIATVATFPEERTNAWVLTDTVLFMNSSINPFLYCWRTSELRTAVLRPLRKFLCKQTD